MPKECYPEFVQEFYANLTTDKFGNYVSTVQDKRITLNVPIVNCMLRIESPSDLSVYTKKGPVSIDGFGPLEQLNTIRGLNGILEFSCPTTSIVTPMAHLLFKVCLANICPRLGSRSNFSCQDVVVVAMLLSGRKFNLSELILKNMNDVFEGNQSTGLPYGLLLTRFFEFYGVDLRETEKIVVKEFLDAKNLAQSHLKVDKDGNLVQIEVVTPTTASVDEKTSVSVFGKFEKLAKELCCPVALTIVEGGVEYNCADKSN